MVLHDRDQGVLVVDLGDPVGELAVPDKGVTTDLLAVGLSPVDEPVGTVEVEVATGRLCGIELHGVLGGDLAEVGFGSVVDVALGKNALVAGSAPVPCCLSVQLICYDETGDLTNFLPLALKPASTVLAARASM